MTDGVFSFVDGLWKTHNSSNASVFDSISDMVSVAIDPQNPNKTYIGTWQEGILVFTDNELTDIYSDHNSTLQAWVADPRLVNISGLDFDSFNNLWVANTGAPDVLSMRTPQGQWRSFNLGASASGIDIANMIVDKANQKWIIRRQEGLLMVFNDNNTFDNPADDQMRILNTSPEMEIYQAIRYFRWPLTTMVLFGLAPIRGRRCFLHLNAFSSKVLILMPSKFWCRVTMVPVRPITCLAAKNSVHCH